MEISRRRIATTATVTIVPRIVNERRPSGKNRRARKPEMARLERHARCCRTRAPPVERAEKEADMTRASLALIPMALASSACGAPPLAPAVADDPQTGQAAQA